MVVSGSDKRTRQRADYLVVGTDLDPSLSCNCQSFDYGPLI